MRSFSIFAHLMSDLCYYTLVIYMSIINKEITIRVKIVFDKSGLSAREFSRKIGIDSSNFTKKLHSVVNFTEKDIDNIVKVYGINRNWLLTGEGNMFNDWGDTKKNELQEVQSDCGKEHKKIAYYPNVVGTMGDVSFLDNPDETVQYMVVPQFNDCKYAINAWGDSMLDTIHPGDVVFLQEWTENFIYWGKIYLVVTKYNRFIKRLFSGKDDRYVELRSDNEGKYPPFDVCREDIIKLYRVKGWLNRDEI